MSDQERSFSAPGVGLALLLCAVTAGAQVAPNAGRPAALLTFEVASVKQSPPPDMAKIMAGLRAGRRPEVVEIEGSRATFVYLSLKDLIAYAYKVRTYQIDGPDWLATDRFDIAAKLPEGASRDDAPQMMQALLADRFKLAVHRETKEHPVLALVVAKGGPKLTESTEPPTPIDEDAPLKPGESKMDTSDGPIRLMHNADGTTTYNLGARGTFTLKVDGETGEMHMTADGMTLKGLAGMMTSLGGGGGRQVVDETGLNGRYKLAVEFSLADLIAGLHDSGIDLPMRPGGDTSGGAASTPNGTATVSEALQKLGLRLERTKAMVEQLVVDHVEKTPSED